MKPTRSTAARSIDRVTRLCAEHQEERPLRQALLHQFDHAIGFDAYAWLLTDPETEVGCSPLADVPDLAGLPHLIRLKYLTALNRWTGLDRAVTTLLEATDGQPARSRLWSEILAVHDVHDVASLVFRDAFGCWGFLDLWRIGATEHFNAEESAYLAEVAGPVTKALRRCQAQTFDHAMPPPARTGPAVLVLSPELTVRVQTAQSDRYLRVLVPTEADRRPIPASAYNVAAQLLAVEAGVDQHPPFARVHLSGGMWLSLRAARVETGQPTLQRDIAVTIEPASPLERRKVFAQAHALSARESELLDYLTYGADTRDIARRMYLSEHTVQDHLKSIFAKTGVHNRRSLLTHVVGR